MSSLYCVKKSEDDRDEVAKIFMKDLEQYRAFALVAFEKGTDQPVVYYSCRTHQLPVAATVLNMCFSEEH